MDPGQCESFGRDMVEYTSIERPDICLSNASICEEQARADPSNRQHWLHEAARWTELACESESGVAVSIVTEHELAAGELIPTLPKKWRFRILRR